MTEYMCKKCGYSLEDQGILHAHMRRHLPIWKSILLTFHPTEPVKTFKQWTEEVEE